MYIGHQIKYTLFLSYFNETGILSTDLKKYMINFKDSKTFSHLQYRISPKYKHQDRKMMSKTLAVYRNVDIALTA